MKYSYRWLKELSGTKKTPEQMAKLLLTHAFEVEGIEKFPHSLTGVVTGEVTELDSHPDADRLRVAQVLVGKKESRQIVCGAPNIAVGQKVAVALPGAVLPGNMEIKETSIRGVESRGMICSARELGLGDDHAGIFVLPEDTPIGSPFAKYFGLEDSILDVKILPDRGSDALAYQGMAREIAALDGHAPLFDAKGSDKQLKSLQVPSYHRAPKVAIIAKDGCLRYMGLAFRNVNPSPSPLWLRIRLILSGLRPVGGIVDITNYLMLLTGQPMHAYDADRVSGAVRIRRAVEGETMILLVGEKKVLTPGDLVIADDEKILALAGVMGDQRSAVTADTEHVFLEIANFDSAGIRRTKAHHQLPTDASYRFERSLDPNLTVLAARHAVTLFAELTGGTLVGIRDIYPKIAKPVKIRLPLARVRGVLGAEIALFEVVRFLALLGLTVKKVAGSEVLEVMVPTRRPDLRDEWNLIEEIGRMYGYDKIPAVPPQVPLAPAPESHEDGFERQVKEYLAHAGFDEMMTYSFYGTKACQGASLLEERHVELANPLSPDQKFLRMALAPLLLRKAKENLRSFRSFDIFEWGSVFAKPPKGGGVAETKSLELLTVLPKKSVGGEAFFAMKGKVEALFEAFHIGERPITWALPEAFPTFPILAMLHPTRTAVLTSDGRIFGVIGEFHPKTLQAFGLEPRLAFAGFVTDALRELQKKELLTEPLPKFPFAVRDISLTFPSHGGHRVTVGEAEGLLYEGGAPLLKKSELFDVYEKEGEKSLGFHLSFGADDRTLSGAEMDVAFDRIVALARERFEARLRL